MNYVAARVDLRTRFMNYVAARVDLRTPVYELRGGPCGSPDPGL